MLVPWQKLFIENSKQKRNMPKKVSHLRPYSQKEGREVRKHTIEILKEIFFKESENTLST
tara:strand:- start:2912 stop:3091 length:180 start_codon:yes stop_codon:yes gene_type:complete